jgi:hypothetical protein
MAPFSGNVPLSTTWIRYYSLISFYSINDKPTILNEWHVAMKFSNPRLNDMLVANSI